ncbi:MAG TPA: YIP1 family protein [Candidatus Saccharicenans sp.]|nr:YIP1 family protein [Candidatus Saccharicenans sp.]HQM75378.1 YIP1 family protein [Candidatus Saccharicenans sp.]HQO76393.1 YIP1 family protein [Candidatus Saccharicenans sp.]
MKTGERLIGVFIKPKETFESVAEKPIWVDALIIVLIALAIYSYLIAPFAARDSYNLFQQSTKLKQQLGEERFQTFLEEARKKAEGMTTTTRLTQALTGSLVGIIGLLFQALLLFVLARFFSSHGTYKQVMAALFHANFINAILGNGLRSLLISAKQSVYNVSTGLAVFFPGLDPTSSSYMILTSIDFFQLWMFGVLAYGLAAIFKIDMKKALIISYLFWGLKTLVNIVTGIWGMSRI